MKTKVAETSVISYIANLEKLSKRYKEIILIYRKFDCPMNNKMVHIEIKKYYPNIDISSITGRTNELRGTGKKNKRTGLRTRKFPYLIYSHTAICPITKEQTKFYKLNQGIRDILQ